MYFVTVREKLKSWAIEIKGILKARVQTEEIPAETIRKLLDVIMATWSAVQKPTRRGEDYYAGKLFAGNSVFLGKGFPTFQEAWLRTVEAVEQGELKNPVELVALVQVLADENFSEMADLEDIALSAVAMNLSLDKTKKSLTNLEYIAESAMIS